MLYFQPWNRRQRLYSDLVAILQQRQVPTYATNSGNEVIARTSITSATAIDPPIMAQKHAKIRAETAKASSKSGDNWTSHKENIDRKRLPAKDVNSWFNLKSAGAPMSHGTKCAASCWL